MTENSSKNRARELVSRAKTHFKAGRLLFERGYLDDASTPIARSLQCLLEAYTEIGVGEGDSPIPSRLAEMKLAVEENLTDVVSASDGDFEKIRSLVLHSAHALRDATSDLRIRLMENHDLKANQTRWRIFLGVVGIALLVLVGLYWKYSYLSGLRGEYFKGRNFDVYFATKIDSSINFIFHDEGLPQGLPVKDFSVRWTGQLFAPVSGEYEFLLTNDDGARLWIDSEMVVDDWKGHPPKKNELLKILVTGWHPLRLDYYQWYGGASVSLWWKIPGGKWEVIPRESLSPVTNEK